MGKERGGGHLSSIHAQPHTLDRCSRLPYSISSLFPSPYAPQGQTRAYRQEQRAANHHHHSRKKETHRYPIPHISAMASSSLHASSPVRDTKALTDNAAFMDKYSRQIGAFGIEAMSKLIQLKVCGWGERKGKGEGDEGYTGLFVKDGRGGGASMYSSACYAALVPGCRARGQEEGSSSLISLSLYFPIP